MFKIDQTLFQLGGIQLGGIPLGGNPQSRPLFTIATI
jgi:hypothetical protein